MAVTGIQGVNSPHIIIEQGSSIQGFVSVESNWVFGQVKLVYAGCLTYEVDDNVFFDMSKSIKFRSGTTTYCSVDEQYVYFTETPALP